MMADKIARSDRSGPIGYHDPTLRKLGIILPFSSHHLKLLIELQVFLDCMFLLFIYLCKMDYVCHRFVLTIIPYFCSVITRDSADQMLWIKKPWSGVVFIIVTTEYNIGGVEI